MPKGDKNIKPGPGRPKGSRYKISRNLKERVLVVWDKLEKEKKSLYEEAKKDPKWFYVNFAKPMLPKDVTVAGDPDKPIKTEMSLNEIARRTIFTLVLAAKEKEKQENNRSLNR